MIISRALKVLVPALLLLSNAVVAQSRQSFDKLVTTFDQYYVSNPLEKIYIHTDKPYYAVNDTIRLKAYVVEGKRHTLLITSTHPSQAYRVVVEGLNNEGQLGRTIFRYQVSE